MSRLILLVLPKIVSFAVGSLVIIVLIILTIGTFTLIRNPRKKNEKGMQLSSIFQNPNVEV